jgi:hypothetical protein
MVNFLMRQGRASNRRAATSVTAEALPFGGVKARHSLMRADAQVVAPWSRGVVPAAVACKSLSK